jgi:hypothetical protein
VRLPDQSQGRGLLREHHEQLGEIGAGQLARQARQIAAEPRLAERQVSLHGSSSRGDIA